MVAPWQSPDETTHFAYAQDLGESFRLPGVAGRPSVSSDQSTADAAAGASRTAFYPRAAPPEWSRAAYRAYLAREHAPDPPSKDDGGGSLAANSNPPLYYLYAAGAYSLDRGGTAFGRLYAIRLAGVLLLVATTIGAWLLAGEVFGRRRLPQLACASVAGLLPMAAFMSTAVNPDALLIATWTFALWLGARVINHRVRFADAVALAAVTAAAILTKATSYALVPPVLLAVLLGWQRLPAIERRGALPALGAAALTLAVPVLGWVVFAHFTGRSAINAVGTSAAHPFKVTEFLSYLWQFYLPRLPFLTPFRTTPQLPLYDVWVWQLTGVFGWLDVYLPLWIYKVAAAVGGLIAIGGIVLLARLRDRRHLALVGFFALAVLSLLGLLHVTEYRAVIAGSPTFLQGRYLLPVVGIMGLAAAFIVNAVPRRVRAPACGLVVTTLLTLQVVSLVAVLGAYYL